MININKIFALIKYLYKENIQLNNYKLELNIKFNG